MIKRIELLVHAGAPSSLQDDDKYKAQAEAYEGFQGRRVALSEPADSSNNQVGLLAEQAFAPDRDNTSMAESPTIFLDNTQLAITGLESQLLTSSLPISPGRFIGSADAPRSSLEDTHSPRRLDDVPTPTAEATKEGLVAHVQPFGKRKRENELDKAEDPCRTIGQAAVSTGQPERRSQRESSASSRAPSLSSYLKTPILDRSIKKRRMEQNDKAPLPFPAPPNFVDPHGGQFERTNGPHNSDSFRWQVPPATAPAAVTRSQNSPDASEPTSELPTSYSLSEITSESSRDRAIASQRSTKDSAGNAAVPSAACADASTASASSSGHSTGSDVRDFALDKRAQQRKLAQEVVIIADDTPPKDGQPVVSERTREETSSAPAAESAIPCCTRSDKYNTKSSSAKLLTAASVEALRVLPTLSTFIHPPEPEVSIKTFTTHVTPALVSLATNKDMTGRYQPVSVSRDLRSSERGHWTFDPSPLDADRQTKFWRFLEQAIGTGNAGWGVWCEREGAESGLGSVKVYCWGEVVEHVYLLLYVASSSQVRKLGARWIDAEGQVVVQMRTT